MAATKIDFERLSVPEALIASAARRLRFYGQTGSHSGPEVPIEKVCPISLNPACG